MPALRDATEMLWPAVAATIASLDDLRPEDAAVKKLAQRYARAIDQTPDPQYAFEIRQIGPLLLDALIQLRATPAARHQAKPAGQPAASGGDVLAQLRASKAARRK